jgi:hypothetical protein
MFRREFPGVLGAGFGLPLADPFGPQTPSDDPAADATLHRINRGRHTDDPRDESPTILLHRSSGGPPPISPARPCETESEPRHVHNQQHMDFGFMTMMHYAE